MDLRSMFTNIFYPLQVLQFPKLSFLEADEVQDTETLIATRSFKVSHIAVLTLFEVLDPPIESDMADIRSNHRRPRNIVCLILLPSFFCS